MADLNAVKNIIRKGTVHSVKEGAMKARVKFGDKGGIISGELHVLVTTEWMPEIGDMVLCLMIPDGDGEGYIVGKVV